MTNWLVNGQRGGHLSPEDRGLAYGDGLFETIALRAGEWRFLDLHFERLHAGCQRLGFSPPDRKLLLEELGLAADGCRDGTAKLIITRGVGPRGYRPPPHATPTRVVGVSATGESVGQSWRDGIRVRYCTTPLSENPRLAGLKTLNRLDQVLARAEWAGSEIAEGLMKTGQGHVVCGTMSNLFIVDDGVLRTPSLQRCGVSGIMRHVVLEEARSLGIATRECELDEQDVARAQELFVSNSQQGIGPIVRIENHVREPGPVTHALMAALASRGVRECAGA